MYTLSVSVDANVGETILKDDFPSLYSSIQHVLHIRDEGKGMCFFTITDNDNGEKTLIFRDPDGCLNLCG